MLPLRFHQGPHVRRVAHAVSRAPTHCITCLARPAMPCGRTGNGPVRFLPLAAAGALADQTVPFGPPAVWGVHYLRRRTRRVWSRDPRAVGRPRARNIARTIERNA